MKKTLFSVGVVFALAALAAVALTSRPELKTATADQRNTATSPNVETRVIQRTVRVKRRATETEPRAADVARTAVVRQSAPVAPVAPVVPTTTSSPVGGSDDGGYEGGDDRHESSGGGEGEHSDGADD